jgi:hypothetical protein
LDIEAAKIHEDEKRQSDRYLEYLQPLYTDSSSAMFQRVQNSYEKACQILL